MAVTTPPFFLQNGSHSAKTFRQAVATILGKDVDLFVNSVGATGPGHGIARSGDLLVSALGSPNMSVNVADGNAMISGSSSVAQGVYFFTNDGVVNLPIGAAPATNPRRDLVVAQVRDTVEDGSGFSDARLFVVTGTPAAVPTDPALPANTLVLARVAVAALATSITGANITDLRVQARTLDTLGAALDPLTSTWTGWTPQLDQGGTTNIAKTVTNARYIKTGKLVICQFQFTITGTGTAGADVAVSYPSNPLSHAIGAAWYYDASANTRYVLTSIAGSATRMVFLHDTSAGAAFGTAPAFAVGNNDVLSAQLTYEAA
jgi:hypothetical protein